MDIYNPALAENTVSSSKHGIVLELDCVLAHREGLNKSKNTR